MLGAWLSTRRASRVALDSMTSLQLCYISDCRPWSNGANEKTYSRHAKLLVVLEQNNSPRHAA